MHMAVISVLTFDEKMALGLGVLSRREQLSSAGILEAAGILYS